MRSGPEGLISKTRILDRGRSQVRRYQEMAVGRRGLIHLLKYEVMIIPFSGMPGALGYYLRRCFAKYLFGEVGSNVVFGNNIRLCSPHRIRLGSSVAISDGCRLDVKGEGDTGIYIGDDVIIGANVILRSRFGGTIRIGDNVSIGDNCLIAARKTSVEIGRDVMIGAYCYIMGGGAHSFERTDIPMIKQPFQPARGVLIEEDVWIGGGVKILDGVTIGKGSVIGAGAVVTRDIPELCVAVGVPAQVIRKRG
ncbi:hypothetical protein DRP77_10865 [Candidatus Poribacteria bacterium]|nr:MAG: hypothetical protein DRP77_10865 [Candidatus Poribacteria bacterium]